MQVSGGTTDCSQTTYRKIAGSVAAVPSEWVSLWAASIVEQYQCAWPRPWETVHVQVICNAWCGRMHSARVDYIMYIDIGGQ